MPAGKQLCENEANIHIKQSSKPKTVKRSQFEKCFIVRKIKYWQMQEGLHCVEAVSLVSACYWFDVVGVVGNNI